jgi:hypothetical protein
MKTILSMKWLTNLLALIALALFVSACTPANKEGEKSEVIEGSTSTGDAEVVAYTLNTCVVSGEELGSMGDPIVKTYDGVEVKFCCEDCVTEFEGEKDKFLAKLTELQGEMESAVEKAAEETEKVLDNVLPGSK